MLLSNLACVPLDAIRRIGLTGAELPPEKPAPAKAGVNAIRLKGLKIRQKAVGGHGPDTVGQCKGRISSVHHDQLVQLEVQQGVTH